MHSRINMSKVIAIILLVIIMIVTTETRVPPDLNDPDACHIEPCKCLQYSRLVCKCGLYSQIVELKHQGRGYLPRTLTAITVENCKHVVIFSKSLNNLILLRRVELINVGLLTLDENAFTWMSNTYETYTERGLDIAIKNSSIPEIPSNTFTGRINSISLEHITVKVMKPFAFSRLNGTHKFTMKDSFVENIESQAFKKFILDSFIIEGGYLVNVASYGIKDITIRDELKLEGVLIEKIRTYAITADGPFAFRIKECNISFMESESWHIITRGPVFLNDNIFSTMSGTPFLSIRLDPISLVMSGRQELIFENNTIKSFDTSSLSFNTTGLRPAIDRLVISRPCACTDIVSWTSKLVKYIDTKETYPNVSKLMWCISSGKDTLLTEYQSKKCEFSSDMLYWIIGSCILGFIVITMVIGCIVFIRKWKKMSKEVKNNRDVININRLSTYSTNSAHVMILPSSKAYRETEIDDFQEEAKPLKSCENVAIPTETGL